MPHLWIREGTLCPPYAQDGFHHRTSFKSTSLLSNLLNPKVLPHDRAASKYLSGSALHPTYSCENRTRESKNKSRVCSEGKGPVIPAATKGKGKGKREFYREQQAKKDEYRRLLVATNNRLHGWLQTIDILIAERRSFSLPSQKVSGRSSWKRRKHRNCTGSAAHWKGSLVIARMLPEPKNPYEDDTTLNGKGSSSHHEYRDDPSTKWSKTHDGVITIEINENQKGDTVIGNSNVARHIFQGVVPKSTRYSYSAWLGSLSGLRLKTNTVLLPQRHPRRCLCLPDSHLEAQPT